MALGLRSKAIGSCRARRDHKIGTVEAPTVTSVDTVAPLNLKKIKEQPCSTAEVATPISYCIN